MKKKVYDIINAGPRHRFTCNGKIVSNCGRLLQTQNLPRPAGWSNVIDPIPGEKEYHIAQADVDLASCGNPDLPLMWFKDVNVLAADCIRAMIKSSDGDELAIADFSAVEARAISYLAGEETDLFAYRQGKDIYKVTASMIYGIPYEEVDGGGKGAQRQIGKVALLACLAKGTLVLTKRGPVPIEKVCKGDYVWDGKNWVHTDGAVFRGNKECLYVNGVWATPDHKWLLGDERWVDTAGLLTILEKHSVNSRFSERPEKAGSLGRCVSPAGERHFCQAQVLKGGFQRDARHAEWNGLLRRIDRGLAKFLFGEMKTQIGSFTESPLFVELINGRQSIPVVCVGLVVSPKIHILDEGESNTARRVEKRFLGVQDQFIRTWTEKSGREDLRICHTLSKGAISLVLRHILDMAAGGYPCVKSGEMTERLFYSIYPVLRDMTILKNKSTGLITTGIMNREILDSYPLLRIVKIGLPTYTLCMGEEPCALLIFTKSMHTEPGVKRLLEGICEKGFLQKTLLMSPETGFKNGDAGRFPTYDLLNCGPNSRFAVVTTKGLEIVHNCSYGGGISALKKFGYDKMPITEEDALHAIEVMEDTLRPEDMYEVYSHLSIPRHFIGESLKEAVKAAYYNPEYHSTAEGILKEVKGKWIVKQWRINHPKTVQFWYDMKNASIEAVENPGARVPCGKFVFKKIGRFLVMRLPSGRNLYYLDPVVEVLDTPWGTKNKVVTSMSQDSITKKMERRALNISILVENAVQAFCRDLLAESMLRLRDKLGVDIVMHIHDECVAEIPVDSVSIEDYIQVMSETPDWAEGMPLIAAGDIAPMYHK